jgi:hypothetical protein
VILRADCREGTTSGGSQRRRLLSFNAASAGRQDRSGLRRRGRHRARLLRSDRQTRVCCCSSSAALSRGRDPCFPSFWRSSSQRCGERGGRRCGLTTIRALMSTSTASPSRAARGWVRRRHQFWVIRHSRHERVLPIEPGWARHAPEAPRSDGSIASLTGVEPSSSSGSGPGLNPAASARPSSRMTTGVSFPTSGPSSAAV